jgi:uncharacterized protein with HEPN domain
MPHRERKNNVIRVRHMLDFARKAVDFTREKTRDDLDDDELLALATVHLVELVCNAAKSVGTEFRDRHPEIPWEQMAGTGERLADPETDVDLDVMWSIVTRDLPPLLIKLRKIIREEN